MIGAGTANTPDWLPGSGFAFAEQRDDHPGHFGNLGIGQALGELCVAGLPVQALHLVSQDDSGDSQTLANRHLGRDSP
jgi:hypothetical protein